MILLGGVLLIALTCGGIFLVLQPKWQTHESAAGGFKVEFPAAPRHDMANLAKFKNPPPGAGIEGTVLLIKLEQYAVLYADIEPPGKRPSDDEILKESVKRILDDIPGGRISRDDPITVSGFPGREVVFHGQDNSIGVGRVIVADTRLYIVVAGGMGQVENDRYRRFLNSFEITDARLRARGAAQQQQRELADDAIIQAKKREADRRKRDDILARQLEERHALQDAGAAVASVTSAAIEAKWEEIRSQPEPPPIPQLEIAPAPRLKSGIGRQP